MVKTQVNVEDMVNITLIRINGSDSIQKKKHDN